MSEISARNSRGTPNAVVNLGRPLPARPKLLIFIVAYNAETTIGTVLERIPRRSRTNTTSRCWSSTTPRPTRPSSAATRWAKGTFPFPLTVLFNPVNQGYGGNQKIGYLYAIENGFDFVALVHGDGQYAPECLPDLRRAAARRRGGCVLRLAHDGAGRRARKGGMPLYKFVGNRILSAFENRMLRHVAERVPLRLPRLLGRGARARSPSR